MGMNGTMMQYFQWDLPADASLWKALAEDANAYDEMKTRVHCAKDRRGDGSLVTAGI